MSRDCGYCRRGVHSGRFDIPREIAVNIDTHARLRYCPMCGAWWEEAEREAHPISEGDARASFPGAFAGDVQPPRRLSEAMLALLRRAEAMGATIDVVADWSKTLVVHMKAPLTEPQRSSLRAQTEGLRYFRNPGDPHNPADEGFIDEAGTSALSFPLV